MKQAWAIYKIRKSWIVVQWYLLEYSLIFSVYLNYFIIQNITFIKKKLLRKM